MADHAGADRPPEGRGLHRAEGRPRPACRCRSAGMEDPLFGPVVSFGVSGAVDRAAGRPVLPDPADAQRRRRPTWCARSGPRRLLFGYRGSEQVDVAAVEHLLLRVAQLKNDLPQVRSLELNLVLVGAQRGHRAQRRRPGRAGRRRPLRLVRPTALHAGRRHPARLGGVGHSAASLLVGGRPAARSSPRPSPAVGHGPGQRDDGDGGCGHRGPVARQSRYELLDARVVADQHHCLQVVGSARAPRPWSSRSDAAYTRSSILVGGMTVSSAATRSQVVRARVAGETTARSTWSRFSANQRPASGACRRPRFASGRAWSGSSPDQSDLACRSRTRTRSSVIRSVLRVPKVVGSPLWGPTRCRRLDP